MRSINSLLHKLMIGCDEMDMQPFGNSQIVATVTAEQQKLQREMELIREEFNEEIRLIKEEMALKHKISEDRHNETSRVLESNNIEIKQLSEDVGSMQKDMGALSDSVSRLNNGVEDIKDKIDNFDRILSSLSSTMDLVNASQNQLNRSQKDLIDSYKENSSQVWKAFFIILASVSLIVSGLVFFVFGYS